MKPGDCVIGTSNIVGSQEVSCGNVYRVAIISEPGKFITIVKSNTGAINQMWAANWFEFHASELTELERMVLKVVE